MSTFLKEALTLARRAQLQKAILPVAKMAAGSFSSGRAYGGPLFAQLSVANPCNQACVFCRIQHEEGLTAAEAGHSFMEPGAASRVIRDLSRLGARLVTFTGAGEPTMHPQIESLIAQAVNAGLLVSMNTNGLMAPARAQALAASGLHRVNVSCNAATPETHALVSGHADARPYERIMANLAILAKAPQLSLRLSFVINRFNFQEIVPFVKLAGQLGAAVARFIPAVGLEDSPARRHVLLDTAQSTAAASALEEAAALAKPLGLRSNAGDIARLLRQGAFSAKGKASVYKTLPCYAGWYFTSVGVDGAVHPCCGGQARMGDATAAPFAEIWNNEFYRDFRRRYKASPLKAMAEGLYKTDCLDCQFIQYNMAFHKLTRPWKGGGGTRKD